MEFAQVVGKVGLTNPKHIYENQNFQEWGFIKAFSLG